MTVYSLAKQIIKRGTAQGVCLATAESCTGGKIAAALTAISGSAEVFERGFVTYSNESKREMLGVTDALLREKGAVSEEVAIAMAEGAVSHSRAQLAVSVTGIAGPTGGTLAKPIGLVYIACAGEGKPSICQEHHFPGNRKAVREAAVKAALELVLRCI